MMRSLALKSISLAFEARLWRIVFRRLRGECGEGDNVHLIALFARILFTHEDVDLLLSRTAQNGEESMPWDRFTEFSASGHRNTYASSFTDVRSWVLRKLIRKPQSFGLIMLTGHFCVIASKYPLAFAEYLRGHRLAPNDPLPCLCSGVSYLSFAMSRTAVNRHDLVLKGFAFIQRYQRLRLSTILPESDPLDKLAKRAEATYNLGRAFHQLGISHLAVEAYQKALALFEHPDNTDAADHGTSTFPNLSDACVSRPDFCIIRHSCAYNLALIFRTQGSLDMACDVLWRHITF